MATTTINITQIENNAYNYPSWFEGDRIPCRIENGVGVTNYDVSDNFDFDSYTPYYVSTSGSNSNSGLDRANAKATIGGAISAGAELIYMLEGVYTRDKFIGNNVALSGNDLIIIGLGDVYITQAQSGLSWTLTTNNTYVATRSFVIAVIDGSFKNEYGYRKELELVDSQATCEATPGTYYTDNVSVWVHTEDERVPDSDILPCLQVTSKIRSDDGRLYLENLTLAHMRFSATGITSSSTLETYYKNVVNPYGSTDANRNAFTFLECKKSHLQNCISINSRRDGFNYHNFTGITNATVVEINCKAYNSGINDSNTNNQCSSAHDGIKILRIGGYYYGGENQTIADVNTNTQTVMVGCELNTGDQQAATTVFLGVDADLYGCKLLGNKLVSEQDETQGGITITNGVNNISGTTGAVTIN